MSTTSRGHKWKPGQSGNPAGRAPGTGSVTKLRAGIADHIPEILELLLQAAKRGDIQASRLLLERVIPPVKPAELPINLSMREEESLTDQGRAVLRAVAEGAVSPSQGGTLLSAIAVLAKVAELDELARRIEALESRRESVT